MLLCDCNCHLPITSVIPSNNQPQLLIIKSQKRIQIFCPTVSNYFRTNKTLFQSNNLTSNL